MQRTSKLKPMNARKPPEPPPPVYMWYTLDQLPPIATRAPSPLALGAGDANEGAPLTSIDVLLLGDVIEAGGERRVAMVTAHYYFPLNRWRWFGRAALESASSKRFIPRYWSEPPPIPDEMKGNDNAQTAPADESRADS